MLTPNERYTENLVSKEMRFSIGDNEFGYVYPQGNATDINNINTALLLAGGETNQM